MNKLSINFKNCYGIRELEHVFSFEDSNCFAIYAQNGSMKTSFAKTFTDYMNEVDTIDRIYRERKNTREIVDEDGSKIDPKSIFVIKPLDEQFRSDKESLLLANQKLKKEYEDIYIAIDKAKEPLLSKLKKQSGVGKDIEAEIADAFYHDKSKFLNSIERIAPDVEDAKLPVLNDVSYKVVFNDKVQAIAKTEDFQSKLDNYINKYDELLSKSKFLRRGVFNYYNAQTIATTLEKNGFFEAEHTVYLTSKEETVEIKNKKQLEAIIQEEIDRIMTDEELIKAFNQMNKMLDGNTEARKFRDFITERKEIIPEFKSMDGLKQKVWVDYCKEHKELYANLRDEYQDARKRLEEISKEAEAETTRWSAVVSEFNSRFSVPFKVSVGNKQDVVLKQDVPATVFTFKDGDDEAIIDRKNLFEVLSQGEKKALYILNIIFEIEARRDQGLETIVIVDDIADSFDYKNKYAIIEYLKDIADDKTFFQIVLTHNFDFFRTVENRFIDRDNCLFTNRHNGSIDLEKAQYVRRPFGYFLEHLDDDYKCLAIVPFVRNILEYTTGMKNKDFQALTSALHIKSDTDKITLGTLEDIIKRNITGLKQPVNLKNKKTILRDLFLTKSDELLKTKKNLMLENKIILSVGIRLKAESFILSKISNPKIVDKIKKDQTYQLFEIFSKEYPSEGKTIATLKKVNLITPQNIHLNSFMYEPILDMSDVELKALYKDVSELK